MSKKQHSRLLGLEKKGFKSLPDFSVPQSVVPSPSFLLVRIQQLIQLHIGSTIINQQKGKPRTHWQVGEFPSEVHLLADDN